MIRWKDVRELALSILKDNESRRKMTTRELLESRLFDTRNEAVAFLEGIEYVNDSAIVTADIIERDGKWIARYSDRDSRSWE